jgi:hypothetical protein
LASSCAAYDGGKIWEAARMAVAVYALVNDGGKRNVSIMTQLKLRDSFAYLASGHDVDGRNLLAEMPLVILEIEGGVGAKYRPALDAFAQFHRLLSFEDWWKRDVIFQSGKNQKPIHVLSRRRIVFALRHKEGGGAHYDPTIDDEAYASVSQEPIWFSQVGEDKKPVLSLEMAMMRQIAWEFLETLRRNGITP